MNQILLSLLCGAAFIGGGVTVVILVALFVSMKKSKELKYQVELMEYWKNGNNSNARQAEALERLCDLMERKL